MEEVTPTRIDVHDRPCPLQSLRLKQGEGGKKSQRTTPATELAQNPATIIDYLSRPSDRTCPH